MNTKFYLSIYCLICIACSNETEFIVENSSNDDHIEKDYPQEINPENSITLHFSNEQVLINNPFEKNGVTIYNNNGHIEVNSTVTDKEINYLLSGTTDNGSFKIYGIYKSILILDGLEMTNPTGAVINNQCSKKLTVILNEETVNRLTDGETYNYIEGEDMKGTFFSEGQIHLYGTGLLELTGKNKHALCVDDYLHIHEGEIIVKEAASDAIHVNDYIIIDTGTLTTFSVNEGIDCEKGYIEINGGVINITTTGQKAHGIKSFSYIKINDTTNNTGEDDDEGDSNDPDNPTGIFYPQLRASTAQNTSLYTTNNACSISIQVSGNASKGLKSGGDTDILKGNIRIITSGNAFYDTSDNDISSCAGIKCDGNLVIEEGTITINSSGSGGKGINVDGTILINSGIIEITTTGIQFVYGKDNTAAKAMKSDGDLVINDGKITIHTSGKEAEGIESKSQLYIHGGDIHIEAYDDCINASTHIELTGGDIYCYSITNDGIDSNGTLTISGGRIVSIGAASPEEGFDCDKNTFTINGGYIIGFGGATSTPTANKSNQYSLIYSVSSSPQIIHIESNTGEDVLTFQLDRTYNGQTTMLFSSPLLTGNTNYTIYSGGNIHGSNNFHGLFTDAEYTKGTSIASFTTSSIVTTIGNAGGPGGGGKPPR